MEPQSNSKSETSKRKFYSESYIPGLIWFCKFLAIVGYMGIAVLVIIGLHFVMQFGHGSEAAFLTPLLGLFYILCAGICFYPVYKLMKFSSLAKAALFYENEDLLATAFKNLKDIFWYIIIVMILLVFFLSRLLTG